jgi:putative chitinase
MRASEHLTVKTVAFLKDKEVPHKEALQDNDFKAARRLLNEGTHGLDRFSGAYMTGLRLIV